jgi:hypothetical protein
LRDLPEDKPAIVTEPVEQEPASEPFAELAASAAAVFREAGARLRGTMVSFGQSVAKLSFAPVGARGSDDVLF